MKTKELSFSLSQVNCKDAVFAKLFIIIHRDTILCSAAFDLYALISLLCLIVSSY